MGPTAVCLDGSSAGYYLRDNNSSNWLLFFEGGGWCYDQACEATYEGTLQFCHHRASTPMGSSSTWTQTRAFGGMLSSDPTVNPVFFDWNVVFMPYCDGTSFSSNATVDGLHFRGRVVLDSIVQDLIDTSNISAAQKIVVSGESAGASAVFYHADAVSDRLALPHGKVFALPDSGFFLDLPDGEGNHCWANQMRSVFNLSDSYAGLHVGCLAQFNATDFWKCLFPEHYVKLLKTPFFIIHSLYDASELWYTLRVFQERSSRFRQITDLGRFQHLSEQHKHAWAPLVELSANGIWAPACIGHKLAESKWTDETWVVPRGSGNTMARSVQSWLDGSTSKFQDAVPWPENDGCAFPHEGIFSK